ncbi:MAG: NUDIX domain-containing protein [Bdellovibrionales bacterium]
MKNTLVKEDATYKGKLFTVIEQTHDFSGKQKVFEQVRRAPGCRLIIRNEKSEFLITREWREELKAFDLRLPGGKVFDTLPEYEVALAANQPMADAARNAAAIEGAEEAGIVVEDAELLAISKCGATITWDLYYFLITKWSPREGGQNLGLGENITITWMPAADVKAACLDGRFSEERSAIQLLRLIEKEK